jgi:hypothetical protein
MQQIHHKKNELFEVESYQDEECTEAFDFTNAKNLYIGLKDGDVAPFLKVYQYTEFRKLFIPYIPNVETLDFLPTWENIYTLNDITTNLSKYIPEDNAVLFLSEEDSNNYKISKSFIIQNNNIPILYTGIVLTCKPPIYCTYKKATIFLPHGTQSELQKANEVAKELRGKYGVEEVNLFVLHCFVNELMIGYLPKISVNDFIEDLQKNGLKEVPTFINKIITTNSTGILPVQNTKRLQVIDCKEIFEEYLK